MRITIEIPDEQAIPLADVFRRAEISRSEAIRRAIGLFLHQNVADEYAAFGLWKGRGNDGVHYQQRLREEWSD
jgi:hypothetical protein